MLTEGLCEERAEYVVVWSPRRGFICPGTIPLINHDEAVSLLLPCKSIPRPSILP